MKREWHVNGQIPIAMSVMAENEDEAHAAFKSRARQGLVMPTWPALVIGEAEVFAIVEVKEVEA